MNLDKHLFAKPLKPHLKFMACMNLTQDILGKSRLGTAMILFYLIQPENDEADALETIAVCGFKQRGEEYKQKVIDIFLDLYLNREDDVVDYMNKKITSHYFMVKSFAKRKKGESKSIVSDIFNALTNGVGLEIMENGK